MAMGAKHANGEALGYVVEYGGPVVGAPRARVERDVALGGGTGGEHGHGSKGYDDFLHDTV